MIKPERLRRGDKVAIVSLSSGKLGEEKFIHKYYLAKERLENLYGLEVVAIHCHMGCYRLAAEKAAAFLIQPSSSSSISAALPAIT